MLCTSRTVAHCRAGRCGRTVVFYSREWGLRDDPGLPEDHHFRDREPVTEALSVSHPQHGHQCLARAQPPPTVSHGRTTSTTSDPCGSLADPWPTMQRRRRLAPPCALGAAWSSNRDRRWFCALSTQLSHDRLHDDHRLGPDPGCSTQRARAPLDLAGSLERGPGADTV